jgi:hypothetical protein
MQEQMRASRLHADIPVEVRVPTGDFRQVGRVRNLNTDGLLVEHPTPLKPGASIGVEFPASDGRGRMVVLGEVAWADRARAGVRVCGMMPHHRVRYERLLSNLQGGQTLLG